MTGATDVAPPSAPGPVAAVEPDATVVDPSYEFRFAVVMTGGVSLAIWMGGVTAEIYRAVCGDGLYGGLLGALEATASVDVITGASAGGLNGAFLATAVSRQLDTNEFDSLRDTWMRSGSLTALLRSPRERNPPSLLRGDAYFLHRDRARAAHVAAPTTEGTAARRAARSRPHRDHVVRRSHRAHRRSGDEGRRADAPRPVRLRRVPPAGDHGGGHEPAGPEAGAGGAHVGVVPGGVRGCVRARRDHRRRHRHEGHRQLQDLPVGDRRRCPRQQADRTGARHHPRPPARPRRQAGPVLRQPRSVGQHVGDRRRGVRSADDGRRRDEGAHLAAPGRVRRRRPRGPASPQRRRPRPGRDA